MALRKSSYARPMSRADLLAKSAKYSDVSYTVMSRFHRLASATNGSCRQADKDDGPWKTAISTLVKKGLMQRHPLQTTPHYSLTAEGKEVADRLAGTNVESGLSTSPPRPISQTRTKLDEDKDDEYTLRYHQPGKRKPNLEVRSSARSDDSDKENATNFAYNAREPAGRANTSTSSHSLRVDTQASCTIDLSISPLSPTFDSCPFSSGSHGSSPLRPSQRYSPFQSSSRLMHQSPTRSPLSPKSPWSKNTAPQESPLPTMPCKASFRFRFRYVDDEDQYCAYKWDAACKIHEGAYTAKLSWLA